MFKRLYKNFWERKGTLRYFKEKLNRRNVTIDVKHYEDCKQFFISVGKSFVMEALLEFFQLEDTNDEPAQHSPHNVCSESEKATYLVDTVNKFVNEYVFTAEDRNCRDGVFEYPVNLLHSFMVLADIKDAVSTGNGDHLSVVRKQLLKHFFSAPGYNNYAIEMLINVMQCEILLSEAEAEHCKWAATKKLWRHFRNK